MKNIVCQTPDSLSGAWLHRGEISRRVCELGWEGKPGIVILSIDLSCS